MSYPAYITATLVQCGDDSCGDLEHLMGLLSGSNPKYVAIAGEGVFASGTCARVGLGGGQYTWELHVSYAGDGPCQGNWPFRLVTAANDPVGNYGLLVGGVVDTTAGQATVAATEE
jgi:hypothetical protein